MHYTETEEKVKPGAEFVDERTALGHLKKFIACVWDPDDVVEIRPIEEGTARVAHKDFGRAESLPVAFDSMRAMNQLGWHMYAGVNPRPTEGVSGDASIVLARCLFADFDGGCTVEQALAKIQAAGMPRPSMLIDSGGGAHTYWRLCDPIDDLAEFRLLQKRIAAALGSDKTIHNPERIMRLPGFLNCKVKYGKPRRVNVVESDPARRYGLAEVVDKLPELPARPTPSSGSYSSRPGGPDGVNRCESYLRKIADSIEGCRGSNPMLQAACETVKFDLSPDQAWEVMDWYNEQKCDPKWTDKQIRHKLASAENKAGHERGSRNQERFTAADFGDIDVSGIVDEKPPEKATEAPVEPAADNGQPTAEAAQAAEAAEEVADDGFVDESFQFAATLDLDCYMPPGIIGDFVRHSLATALYPQPAAAFAAAVAMMATVTGRKVTDTNRTRTNGYFIVTGESRSGKDSPRQLNKDLLVLAGGEKLLGGEYIQSSTSIVTALQTGGGISLFQLDELGCLLDACKPGASMTSCMGQIKGTLMRLYNSSSGLWNGDAYAAVQRNITILCPHAVLLGTSTPARFWESLTSENVTDGLIGRFTVFECAGRVRPNPDKWAPPPESLVAPV
ncbi:MAG: hypothetical protein IAF94_14115, partial [Pirellulaceae bacterium]|nr:hypothetical protein [Pirellulaceae bacterium]